MSNENLAFGIDLSKWNTSPDGKHKPDFDAIAAHSPEVVFIAMRAGISWGYQDPWFSYYMAEAQRIKRVCLAYHVLFPGQPAAAQMDNFFRSWFWISSLTTAKPSAPSPKPPPIVSTSSQSEPVKSPLSILALAGLINI